MSSPLIPQGIDDLFDREDERAWLLKKLCKRPSTVIVLVGPQSAGKTKLFKYLLVDHPGLVGRLGRPALFIDGRRQQISSPVDLIAAVRKSSLDWAANAKLTSSNLCKRLESFSFEVTVPVPNVGSFGLKAAPPSPLVNEAPMNALLKLVADLLSEHTTGNVSDLPVVVVDEVNAIARGPDDKDLQALLDFFVSVRAPTPVLGTAHPNGVQCRAPCSRSERAWPRRPDARPYFFPPACPQVTKAESASRSMHVILATSDYNFVSWLSQSEHDAGDEAEGGGRRAVRLLVFGPGPAAGKSLSHACPHPLWLF